jgi:hypothetical protein
MNIDTNSFSADDSMHCHPAIQPDPFSPRQTRAMVKERQAFVDVIDGLRDANLEPNW